MAAKKQIIWQGTGNYRTPKGSVPPGTDITEWVLEEPKKPKKKAKKSTEVEKEQ